MVIEPGLCSLKVIVARWHHVAILAFRRLPKYLIFFSNVLMMGVERGGKSQARR
jgi:hypothetical protein